MGKEVNLTKSDDGLIIQFNEHTYKIALKLTKEQQIKERIEAQT